MTTPNPAADDERLVESLALKAQNMVSDSISKNERLRAVDDFITARTALLKRLAELREGKRE
jgi:hypothetical protein